MSSLLPGFLGGGGKSRGKRSSLAPFQQQKLWYDSVRGPADLPSSVLPSPFLLHWPTQAAHLILSQGFSLLLGCSLEKEWAHCRNLLLSTLCSRLMVFSRLIFATISEACSSVSFPVVSSVPYPGVHNRASSQLLLLPVSLSQKRALPLNSVPVPSVAS